MLLLFFFFQAEDGIRDLIVTGVQTCALPISATAEAGELDVRRRTEAERRRDLLEDYERAGRHAPVEAPPGEGALGDRKLHPHAQGEVSSQASSATRPAVIRRGVRLSACAPARSMSAATRSASSSSTWSGPRRGRSSTRARPGRGSGRGWPPPGRPAARPRRPPP